MRFRGALSAVLLLAAVALTASACGGSKQSPHDAYTKQLSTACDSMRTQIEALGKPSDTPVEKIYPQSAKIGHAFVKQLKAITPPPADRATASLMIKQFGYYFDGLALGYAVLKKRESQAGFVQTVEGAVANLHLAEGYARRLGAPACAREAFS
jgi:hypothetical protein